MGEKSEVDRGWRDLLWRVLCDLSIHPLPHLRILRNREPTPRVSLQYERERDSSSEGGTDLES